MERKLSTNLINVWALIPEMSAVMKPDKYVGMDVQQSMTMVAVMNAEGTIVLETMVPTAASRIRERVESLSRPLHVTLESSRTNFAGYTHSVAFLFGP